MSRKAAPKSRKPAPEPVITHGQAISLGMKTLADIRSATRQKRGTPAKPLVFAEFLKALQSNKPFDAEAINRKVPDVKLSSIKSWVSHWTNHAGAGGAGFPSNARIKEIQVKLKAALKKAAIA